MSVLSATELLGIWEHGTAQTFPQRALELLAAAMPDKPPNDLARLTVGRRDALLMMFRQEIFGPQLASVVKCLGCGEHVELTFDVAQINQREKSSEPPEELSVTIRDIQLRLRLPTAGDLAGLDPGLDIETARTRLLENCLADASRAGKQLALSDIPAAVLTEIEARIAEADPAADIQLAICCPCCGRHWRAVFDIVSFLWAEIGAWAGKLLQEIHTLASAYGWSESQIVAMHPLRRQCYLEMIGT